MKKIFEVLILILIFGNFPAKAETHTIGSRFARGYTDSRNMSFDPKVAYNKKKLVLTCKESKFEKIFTDKNSKEKQETIKTTRELKLNDSCVLRNENVKKNLGHHDKPYTQKQINSHECDLAIEPVANWSLHKLVKFTELGEDSVRYIINIGRNGNTAMKVHLICKSSATISSVQDAFKLLSLVDSKEWGARPIELPIPIPIRTKMEEHDRRVNFDTGITDT